MEENKRVINFDYSGVSLGKLISSFLADLFLLIVLSILVMVPAVLILNSTSTYLENTNSRNNVLIESNLYVNQDDNIILLSKYLENNNQLTYNQKSEQYEEKLNYFFTEFVNSELNNKGIETYNNLKLKGEINNQKMFVVDTNTNLLTRAFLNSDYDKTYYDFYIKLFNTSLNYLSLNSIYSQTRNTTLIMYSSTIIISASFSYICLYLVVPLCFKRGKKTFGRLFTNISLLQVDGFSCSLKRYIFRFLFNFVFMFLGSVFLFMIPNLVSLGFTFFTKTRQSLTDYLFNTYKVNSANKEVYLNLNEYLKLENKNKNIKDFSKDTLELELGNIKGK